ncbi:MAG: tungstate transporter permease [Elusimicrobia bacterium CG_4_10_14_0_2_um_filter_56_8]|nr:MAG: tungstate transporter permease [Elusimicrobia bacterium CG1_02_56_21]PJA16046.1 MAG: tungstate transporter permease [Elusimicrobia bacterium CG_4_10_14_0_2_um_filter_56_8]
MDFILDGLLKGLSLIFGGDAEVYAIVRLSLFVSVFSTALSVAIGVPLGSIVAIKEFPFKKIVISVVNTGMGLPPVVVGLMAMLFLSRNGPLGLLGWLYTPTGMVLAQVIIATPVIAGLSLSAMQSLDRKFYLQMLTLGAGQWQALWVCLKEIKLSILAAVIAGFGSVISEVGAVMIVGGNIRHQTRVLTTAIVMETHMGNFDNAIALGLILLSLTFLINIALTYIQQQKARTE